MHRLIFLLFMLTGCEGLRAFVIRHWPQDYATSHPQPAAGSEWPAGVPWYDGPDAELTPIPVSLERVAEGLEEPTDLQFVPGSSSELLVLQKNGLALWLDLRTQERSEVVRLDVPTKSEQGLLGAAFHPKFSANGWLFLNHSKTTEDGAVSVISKWKVDPVTHEADPLGEVLRVVQPYGNHNAGQIAFGPDGMLYVGWGDGGWRADPHGHGQNPRTLLGSMLRIDVDRQDAGKAYAVPPDNPWVGVQGHAPEAWAIGFRNPWRYSFAPDGRLVVADVGQDAWEEVAIVAAGQNHGWKVREGMHCFEPSEDCGSNGLTDPVHVYGRQSGMSITGGYVYLGADIASLKDRYVFADFVSGRVWALRLPEMEGQTAEPPAYLGRWPILISTFGRDASGNLYVAAYGKGRIYRISAPDRASGSR